MPETIAFLRIADRRILYTDSSQGAYAVATSRPAVLCIHGAGCTHLSWPPALRTRPDLRVLTLDLPGHGDSTGPGWNAIGAYTDEIVRFVDTLELTSVVVAGHSMGGAVALELALRPVPWLAGLVLVGTGARLRVADALLDGLQHDFGATTERLGRWLWGPTAPPWRPHLSTDTLRRQGAEVVRNDFLACNEFDVRAQLSRIETPALIICGTEDTLTPPQYSTFMAEHIPDARLIQLADAGHMMAVEYPQQVTMAIAHFVKTL